MNEQVAMSVMQRLEALEARMTTYRQGLVTATSPNIQVQLGGTTTSYTNVSSGVTVTVGDVVACLMLANGHDMLIIAVLSGASGALTPVGMIAAFAGASDPAGGAWLIADGRSLLRASYAVLFALIGTAFGSADGTHFNLPDGDDCVLIGAGGVVSLNSTGGSNTSSALLSHTHAGPSHTHTTPNHTHEFPAKATSNSNHNHSSGNGVTAEAPFPATSNTSPRPETDSGGNGTTTSASGTTGGAGSGSSFSIVQKSIGTNFIIRVLP